MSKRMNKVQEQQKALLDAIASLDKGEDTAAMVPENQQRAMGPPIPSPHAPKGLLSRLLRVERRPLPCIPPSLFGIPTPDDGRREE